jgi:hypothetical protein
MAIFETTSLDSGVVNTVPAGAPAQVVTTAANNSGTITGLQKKLAGAMEDIEYCVSSPPYQINGSTQATGTVTVTFNFYAADGVTSVGSESFSAQAGSATLNGQVVGTVVYYRVALPFGAFFITPSLVIAGAIGQLTAGWVLGGKRQNRAF